MKHKLIKLIFLVIFSVTSIFYSTGAQAMELTVFQIPLNIEIDKQRDLIDLQELSKKAEVCKLPNYVVFGLHVPEIVFEEAINFAKQEGDPLSKFVLKYPYAPLLVMYWDTVKIYQNWGKTKYPSFEKFTESFTITVLKKFEKTTSNSRKSIGYLEKVRNPQKEGITVTLPDVLRLMEVNKINYTEYDITDIYKFVLRNSNYLKPADFNIYDIIYDILYNNIAAILAERYKDGTIKKVLPINQSLFEYKLKPEIWMTVDNADTGFIADTTSDLNYKITILYPKTMVKADIKEFYVVKARSHKSSGLGIGYDELYEFLVDNRPEELDEFNFRYLWGGEIAYKDLETNNFKLEVTNIFYECRFYNFDGDRKIGNENTFTDSLINQLESSLGILIYFRYSAIQCLNMLLFNAYVTKGGACDETKLTHCSRI